MLEYSSNCRGAGRFGGFSDPLAAQKGQMVKGAPERREGVMPVLHGVPVADASDVESTDRPDCSANQINGI